MMMCMRFIMDIKTYKPNQCLYKSYLLSRKLTIQFFTLLFYYIYYVILMLMHILFTNMNLKYKLYISYKPTKNTKIDSSHKLTLEATKSPVPW